MSDSSESIAKQDTTHGHGWKSKALLLADGGGSNRTAVIELAADNQKIVIDVRDSAGTRVDALGSITIDLTALLALGTTDTEVKFRIEYAKDSGTCVIKQRAVLATAWEDVPA